MSENVHPPVDAPIKTEPVTATRTTDAFPKGKTYTQETTGNAIVDAALNAVGNFVGVFIGLGFVVIGIVILIQSNEKVQDVQRKIAGAAANINPNLAGAAIAANVLTGKKARGSDIENVMRAPARKARAIKERPA